MNALDLMLTTLVGGTAALGGGLLLSAVPRARLATRRALLLAGIAVALLAPAIVLAANALGFGLRPTRSPATSPRDAGSSGGSASRVMPGEPRSLASGPIPAHNDMPVGSPGRAVRSSAATSIPWADVAAIGWATGIALALGRILAGLLAMRRLRRSLVSSSDARTRGTFVSGALSVPAAVGIVRPVVALPIGLADDLDDDDLGAVLRHERSHVERRDPLAMLLARTARAFHWPNPLAHVAVARLDALVESLADEAAIDARPETAPRYASCLVRMAERALGAPAPAGVAPIVSGRGRLTRRIDALLASNRRMSFARPTLAGRASAVAFGLLSAVGIGCCCPRAERAPRPATTTSSSDAITVFPGAAGSLGLKPGDILRSINGVPVHSRADAMNVVQGLPKTTTHVRVVVTRDGQDCTYEVNPCAIAPCPPARARMPEVVLSDDDGDVHHKDGLVSGYTSGKIRFAEWEDLRALTSYAGRRNADDSHQMTGRLRVIQFSPVMSPVDSASGLPSPTYTDGNLLVSTDPAHPGKICVFFDVATSIDWRSVLEAGQPDRLNHRSLVILRYIPGTGNVPVAAAKGGIEVHRDRIVFTPATLPLANGQYSIGVYGGLKTIDGASLDPAPAFHSFTVGPANAVLINGSPKVTPWPPEWTEGTSPSDTIAPTIVTTSPPNLSTHVGAGIRLKMPAKMPDEPMGVDFKDVRVGTSSPDIVIRFNESIAASSVTVDTIRVTDAGAFVPGGGAKPQIAPAPGFPRLKSAMDGSTLPSNGFEVVWRPDSRLGGFPFATQIEVEVVGSEGGKNAKAITDLAGNPLQKTYRFRFQTMEPPTPPK